MPSITLENDLNLHYEIDDFTDPWKPAETILMLHGNCESGAVWFGWVPHLARDFRVIRPDMRGYGRSTPVARDFPWTIDVVIDDFIGLMDALGIERFHLVGAKIAGFIARRFAARVPQRVSTLTVIGTPPPVYDVAARVESLTAEIEEVGIEAWARRSMAGRLGSGFPAAGVEWWIKQMANTPVSSQICFVRNIPKADITASRAGGGCARRMAVAPGWPWNGRGRSPQPASISRKASAIQLLDNAADQKREQGQKNEEQQVGHRGFMRGAAK